jgi:hypothetical protein
MATYHYRAEWVETLPDPKGIWHIRIYDPDTNCILICVHNHPDELATREACSLSLTGIATQEEIEEAVVAFLVEREADIAHLPDPINGTVVI